MDGTRGAVTAFRLCVDLNVWVADYLAIPTGLRDTACQSIVRAIQDGRAAVGPVQAIVSHAMLSRLHEVLVRKGASIDTAARFVSIVAALVRLGPARDYPSLVLGGGFEPTRDAASSADPPRDHLGPPRDIEDGRVLDAAIAGRADALVTYNFKDFVDRHDRVLVSGRVNVRHTAGHSFVVIQPAEMAAWPRTGIDPRVAPRA